MTERLLPEIRIIGEAPNKRDYCYVAFDEVVRNGLLGLLELEKRLSQELTIEQREEAIVANMKLWKGLPEHYKLALCDLSHLLLNSS